MAEKQAQNVLEFYLLAIKLKTLIRTGWKQWNVPRERLESVAEHVYSVNMLAISIWSEYAYSVNLYRVCMMIAIHELEEISIGDITPYNKVSREEKIRLGHEAVQKILSSLLMRKEYFTLIEEFDAVHTNDAKFAYMCDKLDADLMSIIYDAEKVCTLDGAQKVLQESESLRKLEDEGAKSMSDYFYEVDKSKYDENFREVLDMMYYGEL